MHAFALTVAIDITVLKAYFGFYLKCEAYLSFDQIGLDANNEYTEQTRSEKNPY